MAASKPSPHPPPGRENVHFLQAPAGRFGRQSKTRDRADERGAVSSQVQLQTQLVLTSSEGGDHAAGLRRDDPEPLLHDEPLLLVLHPVLIADRGFEAHPSPRE